MAEQQTAERYGHPEKIGWAQRLLASPLLWGGLLTAGFYRLIPSLPFQRDLAARYFCGHPLEYATTALFFVGMTILAFKAFRLTAERAVLADGSLGDSPPEKSVGPLAMVGLIEQRLRDLPGRFRRTQLASRFGNTCDYVRDRNSTGDIEDHLKYLAELAAERLHTSYALVRTITWAIPILGFLGTVMGITIAIGHLDFAAYDSSMEGVIGGLAVAFDTTSLALALSLVLVFTSFVVERGEQEILSRVEDFGTRRIAILFPQTRQTELASATSEDAVAHRLLQTTEALIDRQAALWGESLEQVQQRWITTLERQQEQLDSAMQQGLAAALSGHMQQLAEVRNEFLTTFQQASGELTTSMTNVAAAVEASGRTQIALQETVERQLAAVLQLSGQEEQLLRLENRLTENLDAVRAAETFEQTLHSLNAAVHLLTARANPKAA